MDIINLYVEFCKKYCLEGETAILVTNNIDAKSVPDNMLIFENVSDDQLSILFNQSEFFLSFSSYEGFGLAALEALASGCIPVLYQNESFERLFCKYKILLFNNIDLSFLKSKIDSLNDYDTRPVRKELKTKYSKSTLVSKYVELP